MEPPGLARLVASPAAAPADQVFLVHFLAGGSLSTHIWPVDHHYRMEGATVLVF